MTDLEQARAACARQQYSVAETLAAAMLAHSADNVDALEILSLCQHARGDGKAAVETLRRVIALAPYKQWPRSDLARLLLSGGRASEAEQVLREAVTADPDHADAHGMLGAVLSEREMLAPGAHHLRRAIELGGAHPQLLANLGRNLMRQGKLEEADELLAMAITAAPEMLAPIVHRAELAEQRDEFERASALLDRAEPIARREGRDVLAQRAQLLSRTVRWRDALDLLDKVPSLAGTPLLLRARLRDRAGHYEAAWADALAAKEFLAAQREHAYNPSAVGRLFSDFRSLASALEAWPDAAVRSGLPQPIFILGFPRSGTTMVEQVLASHTRIRAGGELPFVAELARVFTAAQASPEPREPVAARLRDLYFAHAEAYGLLAPGADYFTDKMPLNETYLPLLRIAFPASPLVTVMRDPRDILVSALQHDMTHGFHCTYRPHDIAHHLSAMAELKDDYVSAGIRPYALRYECFVTDQAGETQRLMTHVGLPLEEAQLAFHTSRRYAPTPSYAQIREPLHGRAIGRWRHYADQLAPLADVLGPFVERYIADAAGAKGGIS